MLTDLYNLHAQLQSSELEAKALCSLQSYLSLYTAHYEGGLYTVLCSSAGCQGSKAPGGCCCVCGSVAPLRACARLRQSVSACSAPRQRPSCRSECTIAAQMFPFAPAKQLHASEPTCEVHTLLWSHTYVLTTVVWSLQAYGSSLAGRLTLLLHLTGLS